MIHRCLPRGRVRIAEGAVLVNLILKHIWIDGAGAHPILLRETPHFGDAVDALRKIPQHMKRDHRTNSGPVMHLPGVAELFLNRRCRSGLEKLAEAGPRVGEAPRRKFDLKGVERRNNCVPLVVCDHK